MGKYCEGVKGGVGEGGREGGGQEFIGTIQCPRYCTIGSLSFHKLRDSYPTSKDWKKPV